MKTMVWDWHLAMMVDVGLKRKCGIQVAGHLPYVNDSQIDLVTIHS